MLDKLKAFASGFWEVVLAIVLPIVFVVGYIYYLLNEKRALEVVLKAKDGEEKLNELKGEQKEVDNNSTDSVAKYEQLRDSYLQGSDNSVRSGDSGSEKTSK